jgi:hypothetical protein
VTNNPIVNTLSAVMTNRICVRCKSPLYMSTHDYDQPVIVPQDITENRTETAFNIINTDESYIYARTSCS